MMYLLEDPRECNDVKFPALQCLTCMKAYGPAVALPTPPTFQAVRARIRGLRPPDRRCTTPLNLFMRPPAGASPGRGYITRQKNVPKPGDYVRAASR